MTEKHRFHTRFRIRILLDEANRRPVFCLYVREGPSNWVPVLRDGARVLFSTRAAADAGLAQAVEEKLNAERARWSNPQM